MGESRNAYRVLVGRPEGKRSLGKPRRRREDNIKMDLRKVGYDDRDWIDLVQDRDLWRAYVRAAMNLREEQGAEKENKGKAKKKRTKSIREIHGEHQEYKKNNGNTRRKKGVREEKGEDKESKMKTRRTSRIKGEVEYKKNKRIQEELYKKDEEKMVKIRKTGGKQKERGEEKENRGRQGKQGEGEQAKDNENSWKTMRIGGRQGEQREDNENRGKTMRTGGRQ
ncbi:hypothetical protein ANN_11332 [Periplaneta americana]|uniref:Uncharacterized protein n=1 Tax=Periplaneta americana TaxID=6978 RepID=A0ABQ8T4R0_PERAM|nr:hypothetical protein ANN_11332 [Periplaneta americana]